jgi:hypothetical protein
MVEPGLDLHEWQTRWEELQEAIADDPAGALPEVVRFVEQMLNERGYEPGEPVTAEGDDAEIIRSFQAARELSNAAEQGVLPPEDVTVALDDLREIYEFLAEQRSAP